MIDLLEEVEKLETLRPLANRMVRNVVLARYADLYEYSDPLTRLGLLTPLGHEMHEIGEVFSVLRPGTLLAITGHPGRGKTYAAMVLGSYALKSGWVVLSNVPLKDETPGYKLITSTYELLKYTVTFWERKKMVILDEAGLFATTSIGHVSNRSVFHTLNLAKISRKLRLALVWIDQQSEGSIPPYLRRLAVEGAGILEMEKPGRGTWITTGGTKPIFVLPEGLEYDTYSISSMEFNVDIPRLLEGLTGLSYDEIRRYISKQLSFYTRE